MELKLLKDKMQKGRKNKILLMITISLFLIAIPLSIYAITSKKNLDDRGEASEKEIKRWEYIQGELNPKGSWETKDQVAIYRDLQTNNYWTHNLGVEDFETAEKYCQDLDLLAIDNISWRLPTVEDAENVANSLEEIVDEEKNINFSQGASHDRYWTQTEDEGKYASVIFGKEDEIGYSSQNEKFNIRCIGKYSEMTITTIEDEEENKNEIWEHISGEKEGNKILGKKWWDQRDTVTIYKNKKTNLYWTHQLTLGNYTLANRACDTLDINEYEDWRLPTLKEVQQFIEEIKDIEELNAFTGGSAEDGRDFNTYWISDLFEESTILDNEDELTEIYEMLEIDPKELEDFILGVKDVEKQTYINFITGEYNWATSNLDQRLIRCVRQGTETTEITNNCIDKEIGDECNNGILIDISDDGNYLITSLEDEDENTQDKAINICENKNTGGHTWFLPNEKELELIYLNREFFNNLQKKIYWSSSSAIDFTTGEDKEGNEDDIFLIRCVQNIKDTASNENPYE